MKSPKNGSVDLAAVADKKSGAFFLDDSFTGQINFAKLVDVGTTSEAKDVLLISRYDAKRATVVCSSQKTTNLSLVSGNLRCKGLHFFLQGSQSEQSTIPLFRTYRQKFGDLHLDDCKFTIPSGGNILLWNNIECRGLNTVKFHNSEFESTRTDGRVEIIHAVAIDTDPDPENITYDIGHFEEIDSLDFYNNVFYNKTPSAGVTLFAVPVFESGVDTLATRTQNTVAKIRNNTFYNMPSPANTYLVTHSLDSLDITNNIFHNSVTDATSNILAFSQNDKERYPYEISGNIVVNITNLNKFNPWRGVYSDLKETLPVTTESIFVSPDPIGEKNFAVKNAWSSCGVRVNCR